MAGMWNDLTGTKLPVTRGQFLATGVFTFVLKFAIDHTTAKGFDREWTMLNYLVPHVSLAELWRDPSDRTFYGVMLIVALPFIWIGLQVTRGRLRDAQMPGWLTVLFFIPLLNLLFFAALSVIPGARRATTRNNDEIPLASLAPADAHAQPLDYGRDAAPERALSRLFPVNAAASALVAVLLPMPFAITLAFLAARVFRGYGWGIFVAMPFVLGMVSAILHGYRVPRTYGQCLGVGCLSLVASGAGMITFAVEGLGCLIMLAPLAIPVAMMGASFGCAIQSRPSRDAGAANTLWAVLLFMPLLLGAESLATRTPSVFRVTTAVEVDAPPEHVWQHVVTFPDIPRPSDWVFRAGVAYPVRARIDGAGVGAVRYCEFSTGPFVEPIEMWDEGRLLKFAVTRNPPPMKEWSPFDISPPHLENFLVSRGGQFKLIELPNGRTRLEGTTWYEHRLFPETYWRWWSDFIIGRIHVRVLEHVKRCSETDSSTRGR